MMCLAKQNKNHTSKYMLIVNVIHNTWAWPTTPLPGVYCKFTLPWHTVWLTEHLILQKKKRFVKIAQNSHTQTLTGIYTMYSQTDLLFHFPVSQRLKPSTSRQPLLDLHTFQPCYTMTV